jgi:N-acetyl sugar amidotransferase|tara:strand:- start:218 stop:1324 length:1107 start_codon:yes stop_codon:yes gene_type:complete
MNKIFWCKKCVVASTRPRVTFNKDGVCSACQWMDMKKTMDWSNRQKQLDKLLSEQDRNKPFQCITAVSGGKDGSYISYMLKNYKKVDPLAVTIRPPLEQEIGKKNLINFTRSGFQHVHVTPDEEAMRKLNKLGFTELGHPYYGWLLSIHTAVIRVAVEFKIPLIFYSEDGEVEYGGDFKNLNNGVYGVDYQKSHYLEGQHKKILKKANLTKHQSYWFTYPTDEEIRKSKIKITHWSFYENWDPYRNYELAKKHCGLQEKDTLNTGTYTNFGQTDQKLYFLHVYLMYLKFGFGRATMDAGIDVRRGAMSRSQAVKLVQMYDDVYPEEFFEEYCDYYKMSLEDFKINIDKWANKDLFEKKNRWVPKFKIT